MLFIETISFVKLNVIEMLRRKMGRIRTADINISVVQATALFVRR